MADPMAMTAGEGPALDQAGVKKQPQHSTTEDSHRAGDVESIHKEDKEEQEEKTGQGVDERELDSVNPDLDFSLPSFSSCPPCEISSGPRTVENGWFSRVLSSSPGARLLKLFLSIRQAGRGHAGHPLHHADRPAT
jgi:hypothetical protein